uniref:Nuclear RNA export factor 3 n=1 Tax=Rhinolophus ferrumequinum TaxID=59479 RepID=A0A671DK54_RHIFE
MSGHNTQDNTLQRRPRGRTMYQRRYNYVSEHVRSGIHFSSHQQQDGDTATTGIHMGTGIRYAPYTIPCYYQRENFKKRDQTRANMEKEQKPPERMEEKQDETSGSWFKIPFGIRYDEKWLLNLIQKQCSVPFTPVEFHYEKMQAQFFVEDASIAFALKTVNGKIWDEDNEKISVIINRSDAPHSVQKELKSEKAEMIKVMQTQDKLCIHIQTHLFFPHLLPPFTTSDSEPLNPMSNSAADHEQVKSAGQLAKGKGLWPEEMSANRNSLCTTIPDKSTNIRSVVPSVTPGEPELPLMVPVGRRQYYLIYDSGVRQGLLGAYHDEACFSLTVLFNPTDQAPSSLFEYFKDNRNMKNLKDPYLRVQLLKHTKRDIVCSLCVLPKTQHDLLSFVVDMWFQTERMLCFSVNGVFKEVEGKSQGSVHAFTRTFIAIPASSSGLCIVNEELFVRDAIPDEIQSLHLPSDFAYPPSAPYPHCHRSSRKCWRLSPPHLG